jgi:uncharacterized protein (TIGR02391 family)
MKRLPTAFADLESRNLMVIHDPGTPSEKRTKVEAHVDAYRGIFPVAAPISRGDVVEYADDAGTPTRLVASDVRIYELTTPAHTDVFWEGALPPQSPGAPSLGLSDLHPEVIAAGGNLFGDGSFTEAIVEVLLALEHRVSRQSGIDTSGSELMAQALSGEPPPIAIAVQDGVEGRAEQEGLRMLFMGVVEGIENPKRHELLHRDSPERTLEQLAMVSSLFHLLDHAYQQRAG